nr:HD domain-containing protein [Listeria floridensis]
MLSTAGFPEYVAIAGLLHDVVEDTGTTNAEIKEQFGEKVAELVRAHTEDKTKSWEERKAHTIETVRNGSLEVKALIVADKLDNLSSIRYAMSSEGDRVWTYFKRGYSEQKWYYTNVRNAMTVGLSETEIPAFFCGLFKTCGYCF